MALIPKINSIYSINFKPAHQAMSAMTSKLSIYELHRRLGHIDQRAVLKLVGQGNVLGAHLDKSVAILCSIFFLFLTFLSTKVYCYVITTLL